VFGRQVADLQLIEGEGGVRRARYGVVECCTARARRKCLGSLGVPGEDLPVGPLGGQGPVESLDLPVLPRAVALDELLPGPDGGHCGSKVVDVAVISGVVAEDSLDPADAVVGEVCVGAGEERGAE